MTRDQILAKARNVKTEAVDVDGETYHVRCMSANDRDAWEAQFVEFEESGRKLEGFRARLLVRTLCDDAGALLLTEADTEAVGQMDGATANALFTVALRLNGMDAKAGEEARKN
ncbi:MAG: hypothetical protein JWO31_3640 [Phycisphaerales bacterium]|nr:hypothetical protein [Phycisphaerales bacterium]